LSFLIELSTASPMAFHVFVVEGGFGMRKWCALLMVVLCALWAMPALAQHSQDYEGLVGDADGEDLNGQAGYYLPPAGGASAKVYTYQDNVLGFPANPTGGSLFVGARGPGNGVFLRSQVDFTYPTGVVKVAVDTAANHDGVLPRANNIGSFSVQLIPPPSGQKGGHIQLATFTDVNTAETWDADMGWYTAANLQVIEKVPNVNFQRLALNHWYRRWTIVDLDTNVILEVGLKDLTTGNEFTYSPPAPPDPLARYGFGGSAGGDPPSGSRLFGGTTPLPGNTMAFDNLDVSAVGGGGTCSYEVGNNVKAKGGCAACPSKGDTYDFGVDCDDENPCKAKAVAKNVACPDGNPGSCKKIKGKKNTGVCG
jgi:hypothetical protein